MGKELYVRIWEDNVSDIVRFIKAGKGEKQLDATRFESVGNRNSYGFCLEIVNGNIPVKKDNAVPRDLKQVLDKSNEFKSVAKDKTITIRMGKYFNLHVSVEKAVKEDDVND